MPTYLRRHGGKHKDAEKAAFDEAEKKREESQDGDDDANDAGGDDADDDINSNAIEDDDKAAAAKSETAADEELGLLQKEMKEEPKEEHMLKDAFRVIVSEIDDLEHQRDSIEERRKNLKKLELKELRVQKKLSMFASIANTIPNFDDPSKISGYIVGRDIKAIENFEFD